MRVIFMGTPDFAVETLNRIIQTGYEVVLAVTQPDKPKGRSKAMQFPPVKECALSHGIEVFQPKRIREAENIEYLRKFHADIIIVAAFGQILPKEILDMPRYGCINVHASLLPKYRGAAPIQWAVIHGETVTGVTIQRLDVGIDTGDIVAKREVALAPDETGGSLFEKLAQVGAQLCVDVLCQIEAGTAVYTPQNHAEATHTQRITKELGAIDWNTEAAAIERMIRGLNPWPSAYTMLDGKMLKIWSAEVTAGDDGVPGQVVAVTKDTIVVQTKKGRLSLKEVQLEGKKRMDCGAFLRGYPVEVNTILKGCS